MIIRTLPARVLRLAPWSFALSAFFSLYFFSLLGYKFCQVSSPDEVHYVILEVHELRRLMSIQIVESTIFPLVFLSRGSTLKRLPEKPCLVPNLENMLYGLCERCILMIPLLPGLPQC